MIAYLITAISISGFSQPAKRLVEVVVTPDRADWIYNRGEKAQFRIKVLKNNLPLDGVEVSYKLNIETMEPMDEGVAKLKKGEAKVKSKKINQPGFLQCHATVVVDGKSYSSFSTAAFSPEKIKPTTTLPSDFEEFWDRAKVELAEIPIEPQLTLMPERSTDKVDVYHVSINNIKGKIYGILCRPKGEGKYPAILQVPGAGVRPYFGDIATAEKGIISFQIGVHGIPVNLDPSIYTDIRAGALDRYTTYNLDDKDFYYYKRIYLGCVRAVDFIYSLSCFNGEDIAVTGGSQGGALSIVTASLDQRIDYLAALYPALSDLTGYLYDRAGGWPHLFRDELTNKPEKIETSKYFDVVNFARFLKVPGWYSWGFNDVTCPPTSMYSAYNVIDAPKELHLYQETGHWTFPEQREQKDNWLYNMLVK